MTLDPVTLAVIQKSSPRAKMVRPFYYRGRLWCCLSNTGHWPDTGDMVPGGFSATATEIVQEGCACRLSSWSGAARFARDIIDIVLNNIRVADERIGDIRAQLGALSIGESSTASRMEPTPPPRSSTATASSIGRCL